MRLLEKFFKLPGKLQIELIFYPVFLFFRMPIAWMRSLWESRILMKGRWSRYMGFHPHNAINSSFYRTQWINLDRYGRSGSSPVIGLGNYPLKNWFHLSLLASYVYANAGAVTTLLSTLMWVLSHLLWIENGRDWWWVFAVVLILFFSSTAYAMAFARQNYQMLGWMWLPVALYFSNEGAYILAAFTWFTAGLSGITPVFFAIPMIITMALLLHDPLLPLVLLPALVHVALRLLPLVQGPDRGRSVINMAKMIGVTKNKVRYDRGMSRLDLTTIYFMMLYLVSAAIMSFSSGVISVLCLLGILLLFVNQRFFRVADEQSLIVINASLIAFTAIQAGPSWQTLVAFWLALNPHGFWLSIQQISKDDSDSRILINPPFDHTILEQELEKFFESVPKGGKVYFAFEDPSGKYHNVFDGYSVIHQLPLHVACTKGVHLFPDWWAVAETNYEGAPPCWGRSIDEVISNCEYWNATHAIIYQESSSELDEKWNRAFELISDFDWSHYQDLFRGVHLWSTEKPTPKWFLLRYKKRLP